MRPSAVVDGSSFLRNDVQFVAREKKQQLKRIAARARTMLVPLHLVSSLLLLLLVHRMKTLCGSGSWPPWETLGVGGDTVGCSDGSRRQVGGFTAARHTLPPTLFLKNNANNKRQSLRGRGWMLQWKVEVVDIKPLFQPGTYSHPQGFPLHPTYLQNKHLKSRRYLCH